jgi:hypothetical protein
VTSEKLPEHGDLALLWLHAIDKPASNALLRLESRDDAQ